MCWPLCSLTHSGYCNQWGQVACCIWELTALQAGKPKSRAVRAAIPMTISLCPHFLRTKGKKTSKWAKKALPAHCGDAHPFSTWVIRTPVARVSKANSCWSQQNWKCTLLTADESMRRPKAWLGQGLKWQYQVTLFLTSNSSLLALFILRLQTGVSQTLRSPTLTSQYPPYVSVILHIWILEKKQEICSPSLFHSRSTGV